jgi:outer membrane biogenesis lipoprotein LolB
MVTIHFLLLLAALVCFLLAACNAPVPRLNLMSLGLAFWVLTLLVPK